MSGTKFDNNKSRIDLIPPVIIEELGKLYAVGAAKYGAQNWQGGMAWGRVYAALLRHAISWFKGEKNDPEDGQNHLIACIWNAATLYEYERRNLGVDDRGFKEERIE